MNREWEEFYFNNAKQKKKVCFSFIPSKAQGKRKISIIQK